MTCNAVHSHDKKLFPRDYRPLLRGILCITKS